MTIEQSLFALLGACLSLAGVLARIIWEQQRDRRNPSVAQYVLRTELSGFVSRADLTEGFKDLRAEMRDVGKAVTEVRDIVQAEAPKSAVLEYRVGDVERRLADLEGGLHRP